ncbi:hypothetical protein CBS101457_000172 [Exobasidium rhododendri]|nr:hypothetical protein CBS101457_000172 [Exobasidium rhododendri]
MDDGRGKRGTFSLFSGKKVRTSDGSSGSGSSEYSASQIDRGDAGSRTSRGHRPASMRPDPGSMTSRPRSHLFRGQEQNISDALSRLNSFGTSSSSHHGQGSGHHPQEDPHRQYIDLEAHSDSDAQAYPSANQNVRFEYQRDADSSDHYPFHGYGMPPSHDDYASSHNHGGFPASQESASQSSMSTDWNYQHSYADTPGWNAGHMYDDQQSDDPYLQSMNVMYPGTMVEPTPGFVYRSQRDAPDTFSASVALPDDNEEVSEQPPWEYRFQQNALHILQQWHNEEDFSWTILKPDHKTEVTMFIHEIRPYNEEYLRKMLRYVITVGQARDILLGTQTEGEAAVETLLPFETSKNHLPFAPWMRGFDNQQRRNIIRKLSDATLEASDRLREHFLRTKVKPSVARRILHASKKGELRSIARDHNLIPPLLLNDDGEGAVYPWQKGASKFQQKAVLQRLRQTVYSQTYKLHVIIQMDFVPEGYGMKILRARTDQDFFELVRWLVDQYNSV